MRNPCLDGGKGQIGAMLLPDSLLEAILYEDVPYGDATTNALRIARRSARVTFSARTKMVVCCVEDAARIFALAGANAEALTSSGAICEPGTVLLQASGDAGPLIAAWKAAQTLIEATSGIATSTHDIVTAAAKGGGAVVAATRKNFPGVRKPSLKAVMAGGGVPHRLGLSDSILIFPEHRVFTDRPLGVIINDLRSNWPERKVAAEAASIDDSMALANAGVDVLQLEKFSPEDVACVAAYLREQGLTTLLAAAGGVNADNAEAYVRAGAKVLVTSAPYWAKPSDVQVRFFKG